MLSGYLFLAVLVPLGMTVVYHNRNQRIDDKIHKTTYMELDDLLATSDVVCVMAPLTDESISHVR